MHQGTEGWLGPVGSESRWAGQAEASIQRLVSHVVTPGRQDSWAPLRGFTGDSEGHGADHTPILGRRVLNPALRGPGQDEARKKTGRGAAPPMAPGPPEGRWEAQLRKRVADESGLPGPLGPGWAAHGRVAACNNLGSRAGGRQEMWMKPVVVGGAQTCESPGKFWLRW